MSTPAELPLFAIEQDFEESFQGIFKAATELQNVFRSREPRDFDTPAIEVQFNVGGVLDKHAHIFPDAQRWCYDAWQSDLEITVTTHRQSNGVQHKQLLSLVRRELQQYRLFETWLNTKAAQYHRIADVREKGTAYSYDDENDLDSTKLTFTVFHNIVASDTDTIWPQGS